MKTFSFARREEDKIPHVEMSFAKWLPNPVAICISASMILALKICSVTKDQQNFELLSSFFTSKYPELTHQEQQSIQKIIENIPESAKYWINHLFDNTIERKDLIALEKVSSIIINEHGLSNFDKDLMPMKNLLEKITELYNISFKLIFKKDKFRYESQHKEAVKSPKIWIKAVNIC